MTTLSGTLDASSNDGKGGEVVATGDRVLVRDGAHLTASGVTGGGEVLVGGNWQGKDTTIHQATGTIVESGALLEANATDTGNGGTVVAWSDVTNPLSVTRAYGTFEAMGGLNGGDGGRIETSGHWLDVAGISVLASSPTGTAGLWLLDPYNVIIAASGATGTVYLNNFVPGVDSTILASSISSALNTGNNVTITTGSGGTSVGDITVNASILQTIDNGPVTLTLSAARCIYINSQIGNTTGTLNISLNTLTGTISGTGDIGTDNFHNGNTLFNVGGNDSGTGNSIYSGNIRNRTTVEKDGNGTLILSGNNNYTGYTTIKNGILITRSSTALGTNDNGTLVKSGATLQLESDIASISAGEYLELSGNGFGGAIGALRNTYADHTYNGNIRLMDNSSIQSVVSNLTLTGSVNGSYGLVVNGSGSVTLSGTVGASISLASFTGSAETTLAVNGGLVTTTGIQAYNAPTTFGNASGTILQTSNSGITANGPVMSTAGLLTFEAGTGNVSLVNTLNDFSSVQVLYAGAVSLIDVNALTLSGVNASGAINIATLVNNLTVNGTIVTANASSTAVLLNAAKNAVNQSEAIAHGGTWTGGDIIWNSGTIIVGSGGRATLYTGSILGSTTLASHVGSGQFRYNSDEQITSYSAPLTSGLYAIYREQPLLNVTPSSATITYGDALPSFTVETFEGYVNGDLPLGVTTGSAVWAVDGSKSPSDNYIAGQHNVRYDNILSTLVSNFGYGFTDNTGHLNELTITAKTLIINGFQSDNKVYDRNTTAVISNVGSLVGVVSGDAVGFTNGGATFASKNVANGITVTLNGVALTGADLGNYTYSVGSTTDFSDITPKPLTITGFLSDNKVYDGNTTAVISSTGTLSGVESGDAVGFTNGGATFASKNVANGITVTLNGVTLTGADLGNYTYSSGTTTDVSDITPKPLTITGFQSDNKVYDRNMTAVISSTGTLSGVESGDTVGFTNGGATFASKNVANGITVTLNGVTLTGADLGNYTYSSGTTTDLSDITPKPLTITGFQSDNKVYDGNTTAVISNGGTLVGVVSGDTVGFTNPQATFASKNVANGITVTLNGVTLTGTDLSNYTYSSGSATDLSDITPAPLTVTARNQMKLYDGSAYSGGNGVIFDPVVSFSDIDDTQSGYTGTSQGAIQSGTYVITPKGYTSSNYNITFANGQLTIISLVPMPPEWSVSTPPSSPPATLLHVNVGDQIQGNNRGLPDLSPMIAPSGNVQQVTRVFMPEEFVRSSSSYIFPLPSNVYSQLLESMGTENVFLQDGSSLPGWIKYDVQKKVFMVTDVPPGALPVTVIVKQGDLSWPVVIIQ